jgi:hypothetical protein
MPSRLRCLLIALISAGFAAPFSWAQVAKTSDALATAPDSATLAKYDKNHNGVLDPDELATMQADAAKTANVPVEKTAALDSKDVIEMSPFTVESDNNKGYEALNTMSGSRLNTKLEDVGASITVVTKQQLTDFAATDINDIFAMEASTEGTRTYTANSNDGKGDVDAVALNPNSANRIRGLGAANQSVGNWSTSNAIPVDVYNIDAVEIARGANSSIFGMGEGSGTVNLIPAAANLTRSRSSVQTTATSYGTLRASIDLNRPLVKDVLAIRYSGLSEDKGFVRTPSYDQTRRMTIGLTFRPFKNTTIRASYENFNESYSRPNSMTATDQMSLWAKAGKPSYDPTTNTWKLDGKPVANATNNTWSYTAPDGVIDPATETGTVVTSSSGATAFPTGVWLAGLGSTRTRSMMWIDHGVAQKFTQTYWNEPSGYSTTTGLPNAWIDREIVNFGTPTNFQVPSRFVGGLTYNGVPASADKNFYDYESINLAALNSGTKSAEYGRVELEQFFFRTPHQMLALQLGFFKERVNDLSMAYVGNGGDGIALTIAPDVNTKYPDGTPNPYFGAPMIQALTPQIYSRPQDNRNYRGNLVYELNLSREKNFFVRFLGIERLLGYKEYRDSVNSPNSLRYLYRISQSLTNAVGPTRVSGTNLTSTNPATFNPNFLASPLGLSNGGPQNFSTRYYMGDNVGGNVDWATSAPNFSQNIPYVRWGSTTASMGQNKWITESVPVSSGYYSQGEQESQTRTKGWVWQGFMLDDRIVPTYGERQDRQRTRSNISNPSNNVGPDGFPISYSYLTNFTNQPWNVTNTHTGATEASGMTRTKGIVVKPFRWLNLQYNQSTSFKPAGYAIDLQAQPLPNPNGRTKDYGFTLNLFSGKLVMRVNKYTGFTKDARGANDVVANRITLFDFDNTATGNESKYDMLGWLSDEYAKVDGFANAAAGTVDQQAKWTQSALTRMGLTQAYIDAMRASTRSMTSDQSSTGYELELNYNPTRYWTMKVTGNKTMATNSAIAPSWQQYRDARMPIWTTMVSPYLSPADATHTTSYNQDYWNNPNFGSGNMPSSVWPGLDAAPMALTMALQGKSVPQGRRYNVNYLTSYRLAGITGNRYLKNATVGGRVNWQDKGIVGYYEGAADADGIVRNYNPNRPIWDDSHFYVDVFFGYDLRLFNDRVRSHIQLNVRNIQESGRLQAYNANPDGTLTRYRIIDPREFVLQVSFDL